PSGRRLGERCEFLDRPRARRRGTILRRAGARVGDPGIAPGDPVNGAVARPASAETRALLAQPPERRRERRDALALLFDHRRRRALDETGVAQLGLGLADLALDAGDLLVEPLSLGADVDLDLQHQPRVADDLYRRH